MLKKLGLLIVGLFICSLGSVFLIESGIGMAPWDVLHSGIAITLDMNIGAAGILVSFVILVIDYFMGIKIGVGSVLNMMLVGIFVDIIRATELIKPSDNFLMQLMFIVGGMMILNVGMFVYISQGLGSGPRDGLMVGICKKTGYSVKTVRSSIELGAVFCGILLGGAFGIGTIFCAIISGPIMKFMFDKMKFDVKAVEHTYIEDYFKKGEAA